MTTKISSLRAREILDSRGNPTVEVIATASGKTVRASVPSGASTGSHEAFELRDGDAKRYMGKGVLKACQNIQKKLFPAIADCDIFDQAVIDYRMRDLDGTERKEKLGANSILAISLAVARLAAAVEEKPLYVHLAERHGYTKPLYLPIPLFNVINGGKHADSGLDIQEFFIIPQKGYFRDKLHAGVVIYQHLKALLAKQKLSVAVGDEGGFAPRLKDNEDALKMLVQASKAAGFSLGKDVCFGKVTKEVLLRA
jgi:enolase